MSERTVQQVFDLAISRGFYTIDSTLSSSRYMCSSLKIMHKRSLLTDVEYLKAREEINKYLANLNKKSNITYYHTILYCIFEELDILNKNLSKQEAFDFLVSVYSDWKNRPLID